MNEERPDEPREPADTARPDDGADGQEARREPGPDAPFPGLRSAADIFGAPRRADEWPSRRERREAERAAAEAGEPAPEPFVPDEQPSGEQPGVPVVQPSSEQPGVPAAADFDDQRTQAIPMGEELARPTPPTPAAERETLPSRIPPAAPVPPNSTAPHPRSIQLPTAMTNRDQRAAEARANDEERRRVDPDGTGREDVDWLGRATGSAPVAVTPDPTGPVAQPTGVHGVLPPSDEPPSFTELLALGGDAGETDWSAVADRTRADRPFDWSLADDEPASETRAALVSDAFDASTAGASTWSLDDDADDDEVVAGESTTALPLPAGFDPDETPIDPDSADGTNPVDDEPGATTSWSLSDEAARTGEVFPGDTMDEPAPPPLVAPPAPAAARPAPTEPVDVPPAPAVVPGSQDAAPPASHGVPEPDRVLPAAAPDDLDQSEWAGRETSDTSAIKDLFGTAAIQHVGSAPDPGDTGTRMMPAVPPAHAPGPGRTRYGAPTPPPPPGAAAPADRPQDNFINRGFARLQGEGQRGKRLFIVGAIVVIVVMLVAVFGLTWWILSNTVPEHTVPTKSPAAASTASQRSSTAASPAPAASAPTIAFATTPAGPGEHSWRELAGGECLSPYTDAWADTYTVVDCATPHQGQLTARGQIQSATFPGAAALKTQVASECQGASALDLSAASQYGDLQVQGSYPPDQATWDAGDRSWSCFVSRAGGAALTGSLAPTA